VGDVRVEDCLTLDALVEKLDGETYVSPEQAAAERLERERIENRERAARMKAQHAERKHAKQQCTAPPKRTPQIK
jgi:septal ring factor EnvC (AmiA/AmiB activator)